MYKQWYEHKGTQSSWPEENCWWLHHCLWMIFSLVFPSYLFIENFHINKHIRCWKLYWISILLLYELIKRFMDIKKGICWRNSRYWLIEFILFWFIPSFLCINNYKDECFITSKIIEINYLLWFYITYEFVNRRFE